MCILIVSFIILFAILYLEGIVGYLFLCLMEANIRLTCNSGPKGLAWFEPSEATSTNYDNRNCQLKL